MKKKICITVFFLIFVVLFLNSKVYAATFVSTEPLGYAINIPKNGFAPDKIFYSKPLYKEEYLKQIKSNPTNIIKSQPMTSSKTITKTTLESCALDMALSYGTSRSVTSRVDDVLIGLYQNFNSGVTGASSKFVFNTFSHHYEVIKKYNLFLPYSSLNIEYLSQNDLYDNNFISEIKKLIGGNYNNFENFFETYGTHILTDIDMGARLDIMSSVYFKEFSLALNEYTNLSAGFEAGVKNFISGSYSNGFDFSVDSQINQKIFEKYIKIDSVGGDPVKMGYGSSDINHSYAAWKDSITDANSYFVAVHNNGLTPIWDLLPLDYSYLRSKFVEYYEDYAKKADISHNISALTSLENGNTGKITLTKEEKYVDSSDRSKTPYEVVSNELPNFYGINAYKNAGYKTVKIDISFNYRRNSLGYQWIIINKKHPANNETNYELFSKRFENKLSSQSANISLELSLNDFIEDSFYINHIATGSGKNSCYYSDLIISMEFKK